MTIDLLNQIAHPKRMYCDYATKRIALDPKLYCNRQYFPEGILLFDMDSDNIWSFKNEEKATKFIEGYQKISDHVFNCYLGIILESIDDDNHEPLLYTHDVDDFNHEQSLQQRKECESFLAENRSIIDHLLEQHFKLESIIAEFWLARNGIGSGFHDQGYPKVLVPYLDASAQRYGERYVEVGDDGVIYIR